MSKVTFVTRFYPPSPNINGEAVCDMVEYLEKEKNISCRIICTDRDFEGGGKRRTPKGKVIRIKTLSTKRSAFARFFTFLYDGYRLTKESLKYSKDSLIVVTTSPPLLVFWAAKLFHKKTKWALWSLDLFPEGFAATGQISKQNPLYKWVKKQTYAYPPTFLIALGAKQHEYLERAYACSLPSSILPCGVFFYSDTSKEQPFWAGSQKITFGYCGNIDNAHNGQFLKAVIEHINPQHQQIVLALYGNQAAEIKAFAEGKPGVIILPTVPRSQLKHIDIHVVSLTRLWTHIAVPSKAVSAIMMGGAILFCGSKESDNWDMFSAHGWQIEENNMISKQVKDIMSVIDKDLLSEKRKTIKLQRQKLRQHVLDSYDMVAKYAHEIS